MSVMTGCESTYVQNQQLLQLRLVLMPAVCAEPALVVAPTVVECSSLGVLGHSFDCYS